MGFTKTKATSILSEVFSSGNKIALLTAVNTETDTYTEASGSGYARYTIQSGDFRVSNGVATTDKHLLYGLADEEGGWGTIKGLAVFSGSSCIYLGELTQEKPVGKDTVPVFKKYNESAGEGIKVTLDVVSVAGASVNGAS